MLSQPEKHHTWKVRKLKCPTYHWSWGCHREGDTRVQPEYLSQSTKFPPTQEETTSDLQAGSLNRWLPLPTMCRHKCFTWKGRWELDFSSRSTASVLQEVLTSHPSYQGFPKTPAILWGWVFIRWACSDGKVLLFYLKCNEKSETTGTQRWWHRCWTSLMERLDTPHHHRTQHRRPGWPGRRNLHVLQVLVGAWGKEELNQARPYQLIS